MTRNMTRLAIVGLFVCTAVSLVGLTYVPESHPGNSFSDDTFTFAPLDAGKNYTLRPYLDDKAKEKWLLGPYVTIAKNIILSLVELDLDWLKDLYLGDVQFDPKEAVMMILPILVLFVIGLLLAVCTPFIGLCFCYCRLCGKCGGRLTVAKAKKQKTSCAVVNFVFLMSCCVMLTVGAGAIWTVGQRIPDVGDHIMNVATYTIDDVITFLDNLFSDLKRVSIDDVDFACSKMSEEFNTLSDHILEQFNQDTNAQLNSILSAITTLDTSTDRLGNGLTGVSSTESALNTADGGLQSELTHIRSQLESIYSTCTGHATSPDCSNFKRNTDIPNVDFTLSLDMTAPTALHTAAAAIDTDALTTSINTGRNTMVNNIDTNTQPVRDQSIAVLDSITPAITPLLQEADEAFHDGTESLDDVKDSLKDLTDSLEPHLVKMTIAFMVLSGLVLLVLVFDVVGVVFGITNCNMESPERRKLLGHCGGNLIMSSAACSFIWVFFYLFAGVLLLLLGSIITIVCKPVRDLTIFSEFLDDPEVWDNEYKLGSMLLGNGQVPLTIEGILSDCEAGTAAYTALKIKHRVDIETMVDINSQLPDLSPIISQVQSSLSGIELLDSSTKTSLNTLYSTHSGTSVDVNALIGGHIAALTQIEYSALIADLDALIVTFTPDPLQDDLETELRDVRADLASVQDVTRPDISNKVYAMEGHLTDVSQGSANILTSLNTINTEVPLYESYLQNDGAATIAQSTEDFIQHIADLAGQTLSHVSGRLANDVASCSLVWDIYDGATGVLCVYFLDALNGLWLSLVLVGFFLIPNIWFGVRMLKYFRRPVDLEDYKRNTYTAEDINALVQRYEAMKSSPGPTNIKSLKY